MYHQSIPTKCPNYIETLQERLRIRANIRRNAKGRKSVEEGKPDRLADLLDEAANEIDRLRARIDELENEMIEMGEMLDGYAAEV